MLRMLRLMLNKKTTGLVASKVKRKKPVWNSLEVVKLIVGLSIPLSILTAGNWFSRAEDDRKSSIEHQNAQEEERERREVDQRFNVWEKIAPNLDRIYSYFLYVGDWKAISPEDIIKAKRTLDDDIYANYIFFTPEFHDKYQTFIAAAFDAEQGWEKDPALRTVAVRDTDKKTSVKFSDAECGNGGAVYRTYWDLQKYAQTELKLPSILRPPQPVPPTEAHRAPCADSK